MCLILFAWQSHPDYPLVVAANRDEFYARPTAPLAPWDDVPGVLAGRDLAEVVGPRGTWLGLSRGGRFAALTNYRAPSEKRTDARSRGGLTAAYLSGLDGPQTYLDRVRAEQRAYNGFNLLIGDMRTLWWYSNRAEAASGPLRPGVYGLSNGLLDTPWPKVRHRVAAFVQLLAGDGTRRPTDPDTYLDMLGDTRQARDDDLPATGVSLDWERKLSAAFIRTPDYGTRASTVLRVRTDLQYEFVERRFDGAGVTGETRLAGRLETETI